MDLGGDRHLSEEGAVPGQQGNAAVTALDVFYNVEDLLPLRLPGHPTDVQDGRHMLLPEQRGRGDEEEVSLCIFTEPKQRKHAEMKQKG